jgi:hypothetical protein
MTRDEIDSDEYGGDLMIWEITVGLDQAWVVAVEPHEALKAALEEGALEHAFDVRVIRVKAAQPLEINTRDNPHELEELWTGIDGVAASRELRPGIEHEHLDDVEDPRDRFTATAARWAQLYEDTAPHVLCTYHP